MKRNVRLLLSGLLALAIAPLAASPSFTAAIGGDFFNYEDSFLDISGAYIVPLQDDLELNIGAAFALATEEKDGDIEAVFYIPMDLGLNFLFPGRGNISYLLGAGVTTQLLFTDENRLYAGPSIKGGLRLQTHEYMQWIVEVQQDLLIGPPDWINTSTRVRTGLQFSFEAPVD